MIIQISSGQGPRECELAVEKFYQVLSKEYPDLELLSYRKSKWGSGAASIIFATEFDLSELEGSVLWICKSPYRPHHKRKNWFIDVSCIPEKTNIEKEGKVKFETFHCGGNGGQNINKVATGVRLTHIPAGIVVTATEERSQLQNRKIAMKKLRAELAAREQEQGQKQKNTAWGEHTKLVRGNPVRTYVGEKFLRKKS